MEEKVLFSNPNIVIKIMKGNILSVDAIGFIDLKEMTLISDKMISEIEQKGITKIVTDTSRMKVMSKEAKEYNDNLVDNFDRLNVKYNAVVLSESVFGKMSLKSLEQVHIEKGRKFNYKMFNNRAEAINWITKL